ncbi:hypothetical protein AUC68_13635 [Methyloceanibacter methanicus]|uniref:Uncharacterized protein n=1 Tax=Methyloceanibacter methanicus TaxID=1774968 RepID=A0A1E3W769_9HYPH|nr:hypothetical protein AUC68_13635 [Methyloceanibacter methanicus]
MSHVLAARLTLGFVHGAGDVDDHRRDHFAVQGNAHLVQSEGLNGLIEQHLTALDGEAAVGHRGGDVAGRNRTVKLTGVTGLTDDDEALARQFPGYGLGLGLALQVARLELGTLVFETGAIGFGGAERLARGSRKFRA